MKELVVISGKGGTGKTSLLGAFAWLANHKVLCDADVDAADLHLLLAPDVRERHDFQGGREAAIDPEKCTQCGECISLCRWDAVSEDFTIDPVACEGCGVCVYFCPEKAIDFPVKTCGEWFSSDTRFGPMIHARLGIAEENSGKLVALVRSEARKLAGAENRELLLTDGPPGVGCPVIASVGGADAVLIVAEPSVSGRHDMERVADLAAHFKVPALVCVNKYDLNPQQTRDIEAIAEKKDIAVMGKIPFDPDFTRSMVNGQVIFEYNPDAPAATAVTDIWENVMKRL